jgi:NADH:ubiquinone oxidoreductase subunit H
MALGWKYLFPISVANVVATGFALLLLASWRGGAS